MVASSETHVGRVIFLNHLAENLVPKIYKILLLLKLRIFYNEGQFFFVIDFDKKKVKLVLPKKKNNKKIA